MKLISHFKTKSIDTAVSGELGFPVRTASLSLLVTRRGLLKFHISVKAEGQHKGP